MREKRRARLLGGLLAAALMFHVSYSWAQEPTPTSTPTPGCTPAGKATNGCWEVPIDTHNAMTLPSWADTEYQTNEVTELIMLRQDVVALRRFVVIIGGMLFAWLMMSFLFEAITGRR